MPLDTQRAALVRMGFSIVNDADGVINAIRAKWHPDLVFTQVTIAVLVRETPRLDVTRMNLDAEEIRTFLAANDPSMLPRGFQKGTITVCLYVAKEATPDAVALAEEAPSLQFASFHIAGILDGSGALRTYEGTRLFGAVYYPLMKYVVREVLKSENASEPFSFMGVGLMIFVLLSLFFVFYTQIFL